MFQMHDMDLNHGVVVPRCPYSKFDPDISRIKAAEDVPAVDRGQVARGGQAIEVLSLT